MYYWLVVAVFVTGLLNTIASASGVPTIRLSTAAGMGTSKPVQTARILKNAGPARRLTMALRLRSQNEKTGTGICNYPIPVGDCHICADTPWLRWSISIPGYA